MTVYAFTGRAVHAAPSLFAGTPTTALAALALGLAACAALIEAGTGPSWLMPVAVTVAGHGAPLVTALAWRRVDAAWWAAPAVVLALIATAATVAALHPAGALAYLAVPVWFGARAGCPRVAPRELALAAGLGAALGGHMLLTASLMLGYRPTVDLAYLLPWLAYDAGISVPASEWFFRAGIFERAQRRWSYAAATALSVVLGVARYLVDPLLPKTVELVLGTVFYMGLLGAANCWLFRRTGSVVPGVTSALVFFAAYRLVAQ